MQTEEQIINDLTNIISKKKLPKGYQFVTLDLTNEIDSKRLSKFLGKYYIQDFKSKFRLCYSEEFLKWHLLKPNFNLELLIGIETEKKLVGFIAGTPLDHQLNRNKLKTVEVNFLCVRTEFRNKRMAAVLISELIRRAHLLNYKIAFFSDERVIPTPFCTVQYFHRAINTKKLLETEFLKITGDKIKQEHVIKYYELPKKPINKNFVPLKEEYLNKVYELFNEYMEKYNFYPLFTFDEFKHIFFNNDFVSSFVLLEQNEFGKNNVVDFISYYKLKSKILDKKSKHKFINTAYLLYYTSLEETPYRLISDAMIMAKNENMDVFNVLNIMENNSILQDLGFEEGTGKLNYNFYNWKANDLSPSRVGKMII